MIFRQRRMGCVSSSERQGAAPPKRKAPAPAPTRPRAAVASPPAQDASTAQVQTPQPSNPAATSPQTTAPGFVRPSVMITETDTVMLQLRQVRDSLKRMQTRYGISSTKALQRAVEQRKSGDNERALQSMYLKKFFDKQANDAGERQLLMEQEMMKMESSQMSRETVLALEDSNRVLKEMQTSMDPLKIERLLADSTTLSEHMDEVSSLLGAAAGDQDLAQLQAELDALDTGETTPLAASQAVATPPLQSAAAPPHAPAQVSPSMVPQPAAPPQSLSAANAQAEAMPA